LQFDNLKPLNPVLYLRQAITAISPREITGVWLHLLLVRDKILDGLTPGKEKVRAVS
jgi:hypothetical protein